MLEVRQRWGVVKWESCYHMCSTVVMVLCRVCRGDSMKEVEEELGDK